MDGGGKLFTKQLKFKLKKRLQIISMKSMSTILVTITVAIEKHPADLFVQGVFFSCVKSNVFMKQAYINFKSLRKVAFFHWNWSILGYIDEKEIENYLMHRSNFENKKFLNIHWKKMYDTFHIQRAISIPNWSDAKILQNIDIYGPYACFAYSHTGRFRKNYYIAYLGLNLFF